MKTFRRWLLRILFGGAIETIERVELLHIVEGDILVFTAPLTISPDQHDRIRRNFESRFPGQKFMLLYGGIELRAVLRPSTVDLLRPA